MSGDWVRVEGESMRPVLRSGDWIGVQWFEAGAARQLNRGELVLGRGPDKVWLVHRLVEARDRDVVLKGDASSVTEEIPVEEIWGKVVAVRSGDPNADARAKEFRVIWLDRVIAAASRLRLRRTVRVLGAVRRSFL